MAPRGGSVEAERAILSHEKVFDLRSPKEYVQLVAGIGIVLVCGPPCGVVLLGAMLWEWLDRGFDGPFVNSGKELSGLLCRRVAPYFNRVTQPFNERFVKKADDAYMMNSIVAYGVGVPLLFVLCAWNHIDRQRQGLGFNYAAWLAYHLIRIGPYFMNFAYVYTLCHKEGHARTGLFSKPYNNNPVLRNVFNWWIGLFYGVMPGTFKYGHSINHHRYNNGRMDVVTTSDRPRDSYVNYVGYLTRWFGYASNISTVGQFIFEKEYIVAARIAFGNVYFGVWLALWWHLCGSWFALAFVIFPFQEAGILLASVNWSWHAFMDPADPENEYVQSITILEGPINVLEEDFHVVHHQYPGAHWTGHVNYFEKHWTEYQSNNASMFQNTHAFEIFGMVLARDYDMLAKKYVDVGGGEARLGDSKVDGARPIVCKPDGSAPRKPLTHEEKVDLIKARLRACWWGPRADPTVVQRLRGKEVGNLQYGKGVSEAQKDAELRAKKE